MYTVITTENYIISKGFGGIILFVYGYVIIIKFPFSGIK